MASVTLQTLIERAKAASDVQDDFVTPTQWIRWANVERLKLENTLVRAGYLLRENTITVTATGATSYTFAEPMAVIAAYELDSSNRYRRLRPADMIDGAGHVDENVSQGPALTYRCIQVNDGTVAVQFWPNPQSGTYKFTVVTYPVEMTAVTDTVNYPPGFEERIVLGMARRALAKEETVNPVLERHMGEVDQFIEEVAWSRQFAAHQQVRNVDRVERGWGWSKYPVVPDRNHWYIF